MTWQIGGVVLPMDPKEINKKVTRFQQPATAVGDFPTPTINQPTKFELQIKGLIWPRAKAQKLDELTKNADTENLSVINTDDPGFWLSGIYAVSRSSITRKRPIYTKDDTSGLDEEVYDYNITFLKFPDAGASQSSEEGGPEEDEPGSGFLDMDADDNGKIDLDGIFEFMTEIFTWGASNP
jgi:hypothetical protein